MLPMKEENEASITIDNVPQAVRCSFAICQLLLHLQDCRAPKRRTRMKLLNKDQDQGYIAPQTKINEFSCRVSLLEYC